MTATPSLVLRGGESVLRFAGGPVTLHRPDKEHHIPLAAISFVHAEGRSVAIVLTASGANEPTIYRVAGVSEAGALAFADAVTAALPEVPAPDGAELVTTSTPGAPGPRRARWKPVAVAVVAVLVALDVFIALNGPRGEYAVVFWMAAAFAATGVLLVRSAGREAYRQWRLPRHGITVVGEFSHYTNDRKVYRYTDATGAGHTYTATSGPDAIELAYDPRAPERAIQPDTPYGRVMGGLVTLLGCVMAAGSVAAAGALVLAAARG